MSSRPRSLGLFGMVGGAFALVHCSALTKVDWNAIDSMSSAGGGAGAAGAAGESPSAQAGASGDSAAAGEAGFAGAAGEGEGATGGAFGGGGGGQGGGGTGGTGGGGTGGTGGGETGGTGGAPVLVHKTCVTAPLSGVAGAANLTTALASSMVLFDGGSGGTGNRGGRAGLDASCAAAKVKLALPQQQTHAVISVTGFDEVFHNGNDDIFHMPENYQIPRTGTPIVSPLGIEVATSWDALWIAGSSPSLVCTGVMPESSRTWLSGTQKSVTLTPPGGNGVDKEFGFYDYTEDTAGVFSNNTCNGWTSDVYDDNSQARVGSTIADSDTVDGPRLFFYRLDACNVADGNVLCIAYNPATL